MRYLSRAAARQIDRRAVEEFGMHSLVLMENAGRGCVDVLERFGIDGVVLVHCGKGNNGGDGFVIARHLDLRGYDVRVLLWADPAELKGDAAQNFEVARRAELAMVAVRPDAVAELAAQLPDSAWEVDALLGTGVQGAPRSPFDAAIELINRRREERPDRRVLAVDIPSGLDCDSGAVPGAAIRADVTCTFVAEKSGFQVAQARQQLGDICVVDIGIPRLLKEQALSH